MTSKDSTAQHDGRQGQDSSEKPSATTPARLPYRTPTLRHLGSVRELTLGNSMGKNEGFGSGMAT